MRVRRIAVAIGISFLVAVGLFAVSASDGKTQPLAGEITWGAVTGSNH